MRGERVFDTPADQKAPARVACGGAGAGREADGVVDPAATHLEVDKPALVHQAERGAGGKRLETRRQA